jgi:hypothetical protein
MDPEISEQTTQDPIITPNISPLKNEVMVYVKNNLINKMFNIK